MLSGLKVTLSSGNLELVGTDLELTIRVNIPAETEGEGSAVIPARLFAEILQKLDFGRCRLSLAVPHEFVFEGLQSVAGKRIRFEQGRPGQFAGTSR